MPERFTQRNLFNFGKFIEISWFYKFFSLFFFMYSSFMIMKKASPG